MFQARIAAGALSALLFLASLGVAHAEEPQRELIMFDAKYCEWCELWREEIGVVYDKTDEGAAAPLRSVDMHGKRPEDLKGIKGLHYTPTFVLMSDGEEIGRILGYPGEDFFWPMLQKLLDREREMRAGRTQG